MHVYIMYIKQFSNLYLFHCIFTLNLSYSYDPDEDGCAIPGKRSLAQAEVEVDSLGRDINIGENFSFSLWSRCNIQTDSCVDSKSKAISSGCRSSLLWHHRQGGHRRKFVEQGIAEAEKNHQTAEQRLQSSHL